jgi:hypothetical protein
VTKWWHVSWKRVGLALLMVFLAAVLLGGVMFAVAYQIGPWQSAGRMRALDPELDLTPAALPDTSIATLPGERIERFGVSFQLPWKEIDRERAWKGDVVLSSKAGGTIVFKNPLSNPGSARLIHDAAKSIPDLCPDVRGSLCGLQRVAMEAKTEQVKWWKIPSQNARTLDLLFLKLVTEPPGPGALYCINLGGMCGFRRGSPSIGPYLVTLELFDTADRHYTIWISSNREGPAITQPEINAIVASIRPTSQN